MVELKCSKCTYTTEIYEKNMNINLNSHNNVNNQNNNMQ